MSVGRVSKGINDDLSSKVDDRNNERDKQLLDCPINNPDAILQIMFSGRQISVNWTIMGRSSLCYLMNGLNLMKGRRLGPTSSRLLRLNNNNNIMRNIQM